MTRHPTLARIALAATALLLTCCGGSSDDVASRPSSPDTTASESSSPSTTVEALPAELQGTWLVDLTRAQIRDDLASAGFGKYAERFLRAERLGRRAALAVTFADDYFEIAWRRQGVWYVGWYGTARERRGVLTITDAEDQGDTSYTWLVTDEGLVLRFRSTTTADQHGIPFEANSRAYFSRPLFDVDCTTADLDACL